MNLISSDTYLNFVVRKKNEEIFPERKRESVYVFYYFYALNMLKVDAMNVSCVKKWLLCLLVAGVSGCAGKGEEGESPVEPEGQREIKIAASVNDLGRATDVGFEAGDVIGVFVVNYSNGTAGDLQNSGNHADNAKFSYAAGKWTPETPLFWKDDETPADFYVYYPRVTSPVVTAHVVSVQEDQSTEEAYKACDFLWGKKSGVAPTEEAVNITVNHMLSCLQVKVEPGPGFTTEELAAAAVQVKVNHVQMEAEVNLATGKLTARGGRKSVVLGKNEEFYKGLVIPQTVDECQLIEVVVNGKSYFLIQSMTFVSGKRYTSTVKVKKTSEGVNVDIGDWEDDGVDHGGVAE